MVSSIMISGKKISLSCCTCMNMKNKEGVDEMETILQLISIAFLDSYDLLLIAFRGLYIFGAWKIFRKSGVKAWWALVPWVREYQLARCANRESEGRGYAFTSFLITVLLLANVLLRNIEVSGAAAFFGLAFLIVLVAVMIVHIIYNVRVFSGLIEVYGAGKGWLVFCILDETRFIPMLVWGLSSKYQPGQQVENIREKMEELATENSAPIIEDGLTVKIKDRTVKKLFRKKMLLRDIQMAIPQGHLVLLLGGSGAGKTTYLNAVTGYEKAHAKILLKGRDMYKDYKKMQYEVGFVPQSEMIRGKDTVLNTLMDSAKLRLPKDMSLKERRRKVDEVMDIFGLTLVKNNKAEKLSGGQRKRLSISMEYISDPFLFILDEPDSGLDGVMARELFQRLREIADEGKIVIVISHTPDRVIDLIDDVIVLAKDSTQTGRLAYYGSVREAKEFFGCNTMEEIVKTINQVEEGGDGLADEYVLKYAEVANG